MQIIIKLAPKILYENCSNPTQRSFFSYLSDFSAFSGGFLLFFRMKGCFVYAWSYVHLNLFFCNQLKLMCSVCVQIKKIILKICFTSFKVYVRLLASIFFYNLRLDLPGQLIALQIYAIQKILNGKMRGCSFLYNL